MMIVSADNDAASSEHSPISERRHTYQEVGQPPSQPSAAITFRRRQIYRGGFRTSICDIFRDPNSRTDCCAMVCCGVFASDRNRYLLTGERPPPLWQRVLIYFLVPALFIAAMKYFAVDAPVLVDGEDSGQTIKSYPLGIACSFFIYMMFISIWGRWVSSVYESLVMEVSGRHVKNTVSFTFQKRRQTRTLIMTKLFEERLRETGQEGNSPPEHLQTFLRRHNLDIRRAHSSCSCCYAHDTEFYHEIDVWNSQSRENEGRDNEDHPQEDCCTRFWDCLSKTFWCCGCWCQCRGCCAIAQEEREVNRLTRYEQQEIDYISFQPYSEYFPAIQNLRENQIRSPSKHVQATSELSRMIMKNVAAVLIVLILLALSDIDSNFTWENLIVLLLTLGQAFFIEYIVHWRWNLFNLSFDSVAKYFGKMIRPSCDS